MNNSQKTLMANYITITSILEHLSDEFKGTEYRIIVNGESDDSKQFEYRVTIEFDSQGISVGGKSKSEDPLLALCTALTKASKLLEGRFASRVGYSKEFSLNTKFKSEEDL